MATVGIEVKATISGHRQLGRAGRIWKGFNEPKAVQIQFGQTLD